TFGEAFTSRNALRARAVLGPSLASGVFPAAVVNRTLLEAGTAGEAETLGVVPPIEAAGTGPAITGVGGGRVDKVGTRVRDDSLKGRSSELGMGGSALLVRKAGPPLGGRG